MKVTVKFEVEKQTKRTFRFKETSNSLGSAPVVRTLYVQKTALKALAVNDAVPSELEVTLEVTK